MRKLSDNPVFRLLLAQKRRARSTWSLTLVPVIGLIMFVILAPTYEDVGRTLFPIGMAFFGVTFLAFHFHGIFLLGRIREPLRYSIKTGVADQFILTGISPLTRITGILSMQAVELLHVTAVYLPLFLICRFLGGVTLPMIFAAIWVGWWLMLTTCLFALLCERRPGAAMVAGIFGAILLILPIIPLQNLATDSVLYFLTPFLTINPLVLIFAFSVTNIGVPLAAAVSRDFPQMALAADGILPLLPFFTLMMIALNLILLAGIVTGRHPLRSEPLDAEKPPKASAGLPLLSLFMPGPTHPPVRTLPTGLALRLFEENRTIQLQRLWEFATGLSVTVFVVIGAILILLPSYAWLNEDDISRRFTGLLLLILTWLVLVGLTGAGGCVSGKSLCRIEPGRRLLPVLAGLSLLRWFLLTVGAFWFAVDFLNLTPSLARLWTAVLAVAGLLAILLALTASLTASRCPSACLRYGLWLFFWLALTGLELGLLLPVGSLVHGNRLDIMQAMAAGLPFDVQFCLNVFFAGSLLLMLLFVGIIVRRWRQITSNTET